MRRLLRNILLAIAGAVVLLLALVGVLTLVRHPAPARVRTVDASTVMPPVASVEFVRTAALLTGTTLHAGNHLELLKDGAGTYPRLWADMRGARRSLTVQLYYITPGALLDTLALVLVERARAGVDVRFLWDDVGADIPDPVQAALRRGGVRTAVFRPVKWYSLHKAQNRSHARLVVIDGAVGYTGGFGIDDRWRGRGRVPEEWRDTNVRVGGPVVSQLQAAFAAGWAEATGELLAGDRFFGDSAVVMVDTAAAPVLGPALAGVLFSVSSLGATRGQRLVSVTATAARERLWITNAYFVPTRELIDLLAGAARRGVDVRLLLPGRYTDVPLTRWAARSHYERLLRAGVRIYEYRPSMVHAKTMVADGRWISVGTMNLDARSFVHNDEINLLAWDAEAGRALEAMFLEDLRHSRQIRAASFGRRPWQQRVQEFIGRHMTKVL